MTGFLLFSSLAALAHAGFFTLETVLWGTPRVNALFRVSEADAAKAALFAKNQGFYNLFLALGGGPVWENEKPVLVVFCCASMLGAAGALLWTAPRLLRGALIQGLPPALALLCWFLGV